MGDSTGRNSPGGNAEDGDSWGSVIFDDARPIGGIWPGVGGVFGEKVGRYTGERDCPVFQAGADDGELGCEEDRNPPTERSGVRPKSGGHGAGLGKKGEEKILYYNCPIVVLNGLARSKGE